MQLPGPAWMSWPVFPGSIVLWQKISSHFSGKEASKKGLVGNRLDISNVNMVACPDIYPPASFQGEIQVKV